MVNAVNVVGDKGN